jgi:hypothetical protein
MLPTCNYSQRVEIRVQIPVSRHQLPRKVRLLLHISHAFQVFVPAHPIAYVSICRVLFVGINFLRKFIIIPQCAFLLNIESYR